MSSIFLFLLSFVPLAIGVLGLRHAETVFQEIAGMVAILIGGMFFCTAFIVSSVDANRKKTVAALKNVEKKLDRLAVAKEQWPGVKNE